MTCTAILDRLLGSERPETPPPEVRQHLRHCPSCRAWQRRLLEVERQIACLPVPLSTARTRLIEQVLAATPASPVPPTRPMIRLTPPPPPPAKDRGLRKLALALALAASLLLFALGWWAWPHHKSETPLPVSAPLASKTPGLAQLLQEKLRLRLSLAHTPSERVRKLADLADEIHDLARRHQADTENLAVCAQFYTRLVREHLLLSAHDLPRADRSDLPGIAERLRRTESEASRLATRFHEDAAASASWRDIAVAAAEGDRRLRELAQGA